MFGSFKQFPPKTREQMEGVENKTRQQVERMKDKTRKLGKAGEVSQAELQLFSTCTAKVTGIKQLKFHPLF